jgi:Na+/melibiose symporter-like transporter
MALAEPLSGVILRVSRFGAALTSQSKGTLFLMRVFNAGMRFVTSAAAIAVVATYPITEAAAQDIRMRLEASRMNLPPSQFEFDRVSPRFE